MATIIKKIKSGYTQLRQSRLVKGKPKIFCIGRNKTGTTSLKRAFTDLGMVVGNQRKAERLLPEYKAGNFQAIVNYCRSAQCFQDFPFSFPETFKHLDQAYPGSKFILTIRNTPEQWYNSLITFHAKLFGNGSVPTKTNLQEAEYVWKGWTWECNRLMYRTPESDPYNREMVIQSYLDYNDSVKSHFQDRPDDLIIINVSEKGAYGQLMKFLNIQSTFSDFPWENKTDLIKERK